MIEAKVVSINVAQHHVDDYDDVREQCSSLFSEMYNIFFVINNVITSIMWLDGLLSCCTLDS